MTNTTTLPLEFETLSQIRLNLLADQAKGDGREMTASWLVEARDEIESLREQVAELKREVERNKPQKLEGQFALAEAYYKK